MAAPTVLGGGQYGPPHIAAIDNSNLWINKLKSNSILDVEDETILDGTFRNGRGKLFVLILCAAVHMLITIA